MTAPISTASLSDVGRKRRANQDHCAEFPGAAGDVLLVCCDGMGGHQGGEVASQLAVVTIGASFARADGDPATRLEHAFKEANRKVRERAASDPHLEGMGTTAVALYFDGGATAWIASVGDSRAYRVRGGRAEQLTRDHSVVAEMIRLGRVTPAEAAKQPHNQLARAIGAEERVEVDTAKHDALDGDRWLLCSDGLWNLVDADEIALRLVADTPQGAVRRLIEQANERGGTDNVTVQVLALGGTARPVAARDDTESDTEAEAAYARTRARQQVEGEVTADQIWAEHEAERRARSHRRTVTFLGVIAVVVTLLLAAALWFGTRSADLPREGAARGGAAPAHEATP